MKKTRNDLVLIAALLLVSLAVFLAAKLTAAPGSSCIITVDGERFAELPLDKDAVVDVRGLLSVEISDGSARVVDPVCKNKICAAHQPISRAGETVICAPSGVMIKITGSGPDFIQ